MDLLGNLPEDLITVIMETLCRISKVSVVVLAHVSKYWYKISKRCAIQNKISRKLNSYDIASEGSLKVLQWARSNGCDWNYWSTSKCPFSAA